MRNPTRLRLSLFHEEGPAYAGRDLFAQAVSGQGMIHGLFGTGSLSISVPYSDDLYDISEWRRKVVVAYHSSPNIPPMIFKPVSYGQSMGRTMTINMADGAYLLSKRITFLPRGIMSHLEMIEWLQMSLDFSPSCPINKINWEAGSYIWDTKGIFDPAGKSIVDVMDWLVKEHGFIWWVSWDESSQNGVLNIRDNTFQPEVVSIGPGHLLGDTVLATNDENIINELVGGHFIGQVSTIHATYEIVKCLDEASIAEHGLRQGIYEGHGLTEHRELLLAGSKSAEVEVPLHIMVSALDGAYLGSTIIIEWPGKNYQAIIESMGMTQDLQTVVITPLMAT